MNRLTILLLILVFPAVASIALSRLELDIAFEELVSTPRPEAKAPAVPFPYPPDWSERLYLRDNPDVADAVAAGAFASGYDHYLKVGAAEGRVPGIRKAKRSRGGAPAVATTAEVSSPAPPSLAPSSPAPSPATSPASVSPPAPETTPAISSPAASPPLAPAASPPLAAAVAEVLPASSSGSPPPSTSSSPPPPPPPPAPSSPPLPGNKPPVPASAVSPPAPSPRHAASSPSMPGTGVPGTGVPGTGVPGGIVIQGIRFGRHPDFTRVVLDVSAVPVFQVEAAEGNRKLIVHLAQAAVAIPPTGKPGVRDLLSDFEIRTLPGGESQLVLRASVPVRLVHTGVLMPDGTAGHRLLLDVAMAGVRGQ